MDIYLPRILFLSSIPAYISLFLRITIQKNGAPCFTEVQRRTVMTYRTKIRLAAKLSPAAYVAFDILEIDGTDVTKEPLYRRKELLADTVRESERFAVTRVTEGQGTELYKLAEKRELEGVVAKRRDSLYYPGRRTKDWVKIKYLTDDDFIVCGYIPKYKGVTRIVLGQYEEDKLICRRHVSLGVSGGILRQLMETERQAHPPLMIPNDSESTVWLKLELVCTVRYMEKTPSGTLRQPVFKGLRMDKHADEIRK